MSKSASNAFSVQRVSWHVRRDDLVYVRRRVFIDEQGVPEELEWDAEDENADHVLAITSDGKPIGTGRLKRDCYVGRMAVLEPWRGRGVGGSILEKLLAIARERGCTAVRLHAQTHALGFYARFGFVPEGEEFEEAGIPHYLMELRLPHRAQAVFCVAGAVNRNRSCD